MSEVALGQQERQVVPGFQVLRATSVEKDELVLLAPPVALERSDDLGRQGEQELLDSVDGQGPQGEPVPLEAPDLKAGQALPAVVVELVLLGFQEGLALLALVVQEPLGILAEPELLGPQV